jgi:colanic acid biosynthesis glycosyl transferase WcaI
MPKIVLINQFFWPDLAATSQLLTDLAWHLAGEGCEVTVICGKSSYSVSEKTSSPPVQIVRVPALAFGRGTVARILSYGSFYIAAIWKLVRVHRPDIVVTMTTPPLLSALGVALGKIRGTRHYIWEMDIYPDVAFDAGVLRQDSWIARMSGALADFTRSKADGIIVLGECMRQRLLEHGIAAGKLHVAENWADGTVFYPMGGKTSDRLRIIYSGNLGLAHDVETIAGAMERFAHTDRFEFVFVGGGARARELQERCEARSLTNARFLPFCDREQLNALLSNADIGLVTLKNECAGSLVPSKIYCLLAAGLPLLFVGPRGATPGQMLDRHSCGWQIDCGDVSGLVDLLEHLALHPEHIAKASNGAREVFLMHYHRAAGVQRIARILGFQQGRPAAAGHRIPQSSSV